MAKRISKVELIKDSDLQKAAKKWASTVAKYAPHTHLKKIGYSTKKTGKSKIITLVMPPDALAWDRGSGLHRQKGKKSKYIIKAKDPTGFLSFPWDKVNAQTPRGKKFRGISRKTGQPIFKYVEHPGVEGTNYIDKAKKENREYIKSIAAGNAKSAFRLYLKEVAEEISRDK